MSKGHKPGGGIASRQHVKTAVRTGAAPAGKRPAAVAQIGKSVGNHATGQGKTLPYRGETMRTQGRPNERLGNEVALNVGTGGPGAGRTVYGCGSQQGVSSNRQMPPGRDALEGE
jgi:hypothetical protein